MADVEQMLQDSALWSDCRKRVFWENFPFDHIGVIANGSIHCCDCLFFFGAKAKDGMPAAQCLDCIVHLASSFCNVIGLLCCLTCLLHDCMACMQYVNCI